MPENVTIYTMDGCPHCAAAKQCLDEHGVDYTEYDVYSSEERWQEAMEKADGNDIVPVIDIDGDVFYGAWQDIRDDVTTALES